MADADDLPHPSSPPVPPTQTIRESAPVDDTLVMMKREIDALQIAITGSSKPWYKNVSTLISVMALLFSFGTTYVSCKRTQAQELLARRQELRSLLQRMAALPKENVELSKKFSDDPAAIGTVSGFINQENTLLSRQAAEIARSLPSGMVSPTELYAVALALQAAYELTTAKEFLTMSIDNASDFNTEISALRALAGLRLNTGEVEAGRAMFERARRIFEKYPGYDPFTRASTQVWTELFWASSEAGLGQMMLANQHVAKAEEVVSSLAPSPGADMLRSQVQQLKMRLTASPAPSLALPQAATPAPDPLVGQRP